MMVVFKVKKQVLKSNASVMFSSTCAAETHTGTHQSRGTSGLESILVETVEGVVNFTAGFIWAMLRWPTSGVVLREPGTKFPDKGSNAAVST